LRFTLAPQARQDLRSAVSYLLDRNPAALVALKQQDAQAFVPREVVRPLGQHKTAERVGVVADLSVLPGRNCRQKVLVHRRECPTGQVHQFE
jgi:plasmid stabilization system protein ParE